MRRKNARWPGRCFDDVSVGVLLWLYFVHPHEKTRLVKLPSSSSSDGAHQIHQAQQAVRCHCVLRDAVKRRRAEPADCAVLTVHRYCERARKRAEFNSYQRPHHVSNAACIDSLYTDRCVFGSLSCRARLGARVRRPRHAARRRPVPAIFEAALGACPHVCGATKTLPVRAAGSGSSSTRRLVAAPRVVRHAI